MKQFCSQSTILKDYYNYRQESIWIMWHLEMMIKIIHMI